MVAKLKSQLQSTRKSAKRRVAKARTGHILTALTTGAVSGVMARKNVDLPFAGEIGTAAVAAIALGGLGYWFRNETLMDSGVVFAAMAVHEFVEDSPMLSAID